MPQPTSAKQIPNIKILGVNQLIGNRYENEGIQPLRFAPTPESLLEGELRFRPGAFIDASHAIETALAANSVIAWAAAARFRAVARLAETIAEEARPRRESQPERFRGDEIHAMALSEVATSLAMAESAAARLVEDATALCGPHRPALEALEAGDISEADVRAILDQARDLPSEDAPHFARTALLRTRTSTGRRRTPAELRSCLRRLRERLHPETTPARKAAAMGERGLCFAPEPDGMCTLSARLPAEAGQAIFSRIDSAARGAAACPGETRTLPQLRADALAQHFLAADPQAGPTPPSGPTAQGAPALRPEVVLTIPVGVALGSQTSGAELEGHGPIDAPTARCLASLAPSWHQLLVDPHTGHALGVGRSAYRPPAALRRYLA